MCDNDAKNISESFEWKCKNANQIRNLARKKKKYYVALCVVLFTEVKFYFFKIFGCLCNVLISCFAYFFSHSYFYEISYWTNNDLFEWFYFQ